ncbi:hypothetical protein [Yoonia sp. 1_MG-2023]|nr:hypothetical protein [Yoonia sp. 1_MG-2023]
MVLFALQPKVDPQLTYAVVFLICQICLPLWAQIRNRSVVALFTIAMMLYIALSCADFVVLSLTRNAMTSDQPANVDTYYIVGLSNAALGNAFPMAFFATATWMLSRYGALIYPRTTVLLFWFLHISLLCTNFLPSFMFNIFPHPRHYIDYPDFLASINLVTAFTSLLSFLAVVVLCGLLVWSSFNARRRTWFKRPTPPPLAYAARTF